MKKSGLADSPFFAMPHQKAATVPVSDKSPITKQKKKKKIQPRKSSEAMIPRNHDTTTPSNHDTMVPRYHDTIVELIRKAVREIGKEAATHRFTVEEKRAVAKVVFTYKNQGTITSENEIARIAINYVINDYNENGESSILSKVLRALNE